MPVLALYVVAFIFLSGVMAAVEAAVLNISPAEVEELRHAGKWGAASLKAITRRLTRPVVVMVILTNTINVLGPILAGHKAIDLYGDAAIGFITAVLTLGTIICSEIIPKSIGAHYAPHIGRFASPVLRAAIFVLFPIVWLLERFSGFFKTGERHIGTEAQIRSLTKIGRQAGLIEGDEGQLIQRAFILNDTTAADIMTPIGEVVGIDSGTTIRQAAEHVFRHAFSRYPVFGKSVDEIYGLALSRDILEAVTGGRDHEPVTSISRPCLTVAAGAKCDALLVRFRDARLHLAMVRRDDETIGLVTLEDVLEELVGEIEDEKDAAG